MSPKAEMDWGEVLSLVSREQERKYGKTSMRKRSYETDLADLKLEIIYLKNALREASSYVRHVAELIR